MLSRKYRIKKDDIENIVKNGRGPHFDFFYAKIYPNKIKSSRFVVIVSKKVEKTSIRRHLIKRRFWSIIDKFDKKNLNKSIDYVFFIKKFFNAEVLRDIRKQIESVVLE